MWCFRFLVSENVFKFVIYIYLFQFPMETVLAENRVFSLSVGAKVSSNLPRRGATLYDSYQINPILYLGFFDHRIQFLVNSLEYNDDLIPNVLRGRTKIGSVSDRPFFETGEPIGFRNSRRNSFEWTNTLELFFPDRIEYIGEVDFRYIKDLKAHSGHFMEITPRLTLIKFRFQEKGLTFQPQVFATLGWGDGRHNYYQYGISALDSSINHYMVGLQVVAPPQIDTAYPILQIARYQLLGPKNKNGELVRDKTSGYHVSLTLAYAIL